MQRRRFLSGVSLLALAGSTQAWAQPTSVHPGPVAGPSPPGFRSGLGPRASGTAPSLNLDFTTGTLDPAVTFTRAAGPATYFNSAGTLTTAATNVPRFDYDPASLQIRGLLMEEGRTNSIKNSTIVGAAAGTPGTLPTGWTDSLAGLTRQVVGTGTENGINYIEIRYSGTTTGASWSLNFGAVQDIAAANGQTWAESWYLRLTAGSLANVNTVQMIHQFYDATPTFLNAASQTIVPVSGGSLAAQRFTYANTIAVANTAYLYPYLKFNTSISAAIDVTFRIGGVQTEQGAFATSYIPTTNAAATRPVETATAPTGTWYNLSAGTLDAEFIENQVTPSGTQGGVVRIDDGTNNNYIVLFSNSSGNLVASSNTQSALQINSSLGALVLGTINKLSVTYAAGQLWTGQANGNTAISGSGTAVLPQPNRLMIGSDNVTPTAYLVNGWMRRIKYWPRALSAAEQLAENGGSTLDISLMAAPLDSRLTFTRASTATYFDVNGVMQTAASGAPRYDFDPITHAPLGLLIEEQRQNLWPFSADLSTTSSNAPPADSIKTPNAGVAPDGTTTATKIVPSTGNAVHLSYRTFTGATSTTYVASFFFKPAGYSQVQVALGNTGFPANLNANFDIQNGVVLATGAAALASGIIPVGNGWYRCWVAGTSQASAGTYVCNFTPYSGTISFAGDGVSGVLAWGGQVEAANTAAPFPTSYIATGASTVTRPGDTVSGLPGPWFAASAGSMAGDFLITNRAAVGAGNAPVIWELDNGAVNDTVTLRVANVAVGEIRVFNASTSTGAAAPANVWSQGTTTQKLAGTYTATALTACLNAGAVASGANTALPAISRVLVGSGRTQALSGYVQRVRYWPRVLANSELQAVTT